MESNAKHLLIIYHHPCFDGAFGAVNVYQFYTVLSPKKYHITFLPCKTGEWVDKENIDEYKKIIIVDVDISRIGYDLLLKKETNDIVIFDHHLTSINTFNTDIMPLFIIAGYNNSSYPNKTIKAVFDKTNKHSGCGLTFNYYKEKAQRKQYNKESISKIFNDNWELVNHYVEDSDTGRNVLKSSEEFKSGLCSEFHQKYYQFDFTNKTNVKYSIYKILSINVKFTISSGEKSLRKYRKKAKSDLLREKTFLFKLEYSKEKSWTFLIQITQHKQYRNYNCPILANISLMNGYSPVGGYLYYDDYGVRLLLFN